MSRLEKRSSSATWPGKFTNSPTKKVYKSWLPVKKAEDRDDGQHAKAPLPRRRTQQSTKYCPESVMQTFCLLQHQACEKLSHVLSVVSQQPDKVTERGKVNRKRPSWHLRLQLYDLKGEIMRSAAHAHKNNWPNRKKNKQTVSRLHLQGQNLQNRRGSLWALVSRQKSLMRPNRAHRREVQAG